MKKYDIALLGGDKRTAYMALLLEEKGFRLICYGLEDISAEIRCSRAETLREAAEGADIIAGGIPLMREGRLAAGRELPDGSAQELLGALRKGQKLFAGVIPEGFQAQCAELGVECWDFMQQEELAIFNAIATAEGVIAEAIREGDTNLHKSPCLVLGYGRCGRVLAEKLKGLSAGVTVASAQREELARAYAAGMDILELNRLEQQLGAFHYIFNTVPALVIGEKQLKKAGRQALILDIASGAGGVDCREAELLGIRVLRCPGLPGKYAGRASAAALVEFILKADKTPTSIGGE